jgi:hypothetical protein
LGGDAGEVALTEEKEGGREIGEVVDAVGDGLGEAPEKGEGAQGDDEGGDSEPGD